jgi:hypothetical protein
MRWRIAAIVDIRRALGEIYRAAGKLENDQLDQRVGAGNLNDNCGLVATLRLPISGIRLGIREQCVNL